MVTIRDAMTDPALFGDQFGGESFTAWRALLAAFYGLPLNRKERRIFEAITRRSETPKQALEELWLALARRGGKSQCAALLAVYEAAFRDHSDRLAPGEVATVAVLAADRKQSRSVFRYVSGLLRSNPMLERMIVREDRESIELSNGTAIEITTASFRSTRGYTFAAVICDEIAFWRSDESANPDAEIIAAVRPGLATLGGPLICISSPYAKTGELWRTYREHFGKEGPILVAQADTRTMNPTVPERVITQAYERDAASASAEYGGQFRDDLEAFVNRETVDRCTRDEPLELPPLSGVTYKAFTDPAGGSGKDAFTLAIGHRERERIVIDLVRETRPPFRPAEVIRQFAETLKTYNCRRVTGDRFGGEFPRERFRESGIEYEIADRPRSDLYRDSLPMLNGGTLELPPLEKLARQFSALQRRKGRSGKDMIDHPPGQASHDDMSNAAAGCACLLEGRQLGEGIRKLNTW